MSPEIPQQIPLKVGFKEELIFDNYLPGNNAVAVGTVRHALAALNEHLIYLWGPSGVGVSHLLQASVYDLQQQGLDALYLPLNDCFEFGPEALEGLDESDAIAIDDIDLIGDHPQWQEALFHFYNRMRDSGRLILVGARCSPLALEMSLADLKSRLSSGLTLQLQPLSDEERVDWVVWKGRKRGLRIERDVAEFLIVRHNQNMAELTVTFEKLDAASLVEKRRVTIPFLKRVLAL